MFSRHSHVGLALFGLALYGGPVLAGLAGHGWAVLPVFAALFLFYVAATRKPDLATGAGWAGLVLMALMQVVLVLASYGLGLLIAAFLGPVMLPLWGPLVITAVAAGFGAWAMRDAAEMDVMLEDALQAIEKLDRHVPLADPWPEPGSDAVAAVERAVERLQALPEPRVAVIDPIVAALWEEVQIAGFDPLYDAAGTGDMAVDLGLLRFVASPRARHLLIERGEAGLAVTLLLNAPDRAVRAEARANLTDLIGDGAPVSQLPDPVWLAELAETFPGEGFEALMVQSKGG